MIGELTGVPPEDRHFLHEYSDLVVSAVQEQDPALQQAAIDRVSDFDVHFLEVIHARRNAVGKPDDAMTALIEYRDDDGRHLSDEKVLLHLTKDLVTGGIDTTTHLVGNLFYDILSTPGTYERLRDDRSLVPSAVEECLRHRPVVNILFRRPAADQVIGDVTIPAGSTVALGYASANRDETIFEHAERYDIDRGDVLRRHLGFGWGVHLCVGAPLARLEAAHVLNAALDRIPSMRLAPGFEYQRVKMFMMRGPARSTWSSTPRPPITDLQPFARLLPGVRHGSGPCRPLSLFRAPVEPVRAVLGGLSSNSVNIRSVVRCRILCPLGAHFGGWLRLAHATRWGGWGTHGRHRFSRGALRVERW